MSCERQAITVFLESKNKILLLLHSDYVRTNKGSLIISFGLRHRLSLIVLVFHPVITSSGTRLILVK